MIDRYGLINIKTNHSDKGYRIDQMLIDQGPIGLEIHSPTNTPILPKYKMSWTDTLYLFWEQINTFRMRYNTFDQIRIEQLAEHFHIAVG